MVTEKRFEPSVRFNWKVARSGYHWIETRKGRFLCAVDALKPDWLNTFERYERRYPPLEDFTGLFRTFAELKPDERQVLAFANRFGLLGIGENLPLDSDFGSVMVQAESLKVWSEKIAQLKRLVLLWDVIASGDRKLLAEIREKLVSPDLPLTVQRGFHLDDDNPAMPLLSQIQRVADQILQEHIHTRLLFPGNEPGLKVFLEPQNLLGAIWLQFAAAVDARKMFTKCAQCAESFEISRDLAGKRRSARFCSDRCRVAHYRERIERARQLKSTGEPVREIARQLNTDTSTVRHWLGREGSSERKK
ncbi:MAG: hypothetical protein ACLQDV_16590 [Candidatus Binataceae bacterium]